MGALALLVIGPASFSDPGGDEGARNAGSDVAQ
jgi:hypothetical protein